ncbi:MarR family winged helix-turn-helix transcriptional regulator [uncultured Bifidobacterium sp.]|uniref:MarR family winged helix-turn-helix transcriptional regulator n=1 Tax=uncultured Bifidobacterium sp. TaxID=165187 RepID=UPI0028DCAD54|nr:MarR family winged helix-turn-helix transcriptional regulator [uncultured Bifidobacterium sp.]
MTTVSLVDTRSIGIDINGLSRRIRRYLNATMPAGARIATGGNAHIIMFLAHHRDQVVVQRDIEKRFCITRSTASRVLALMERKRLIVREPVSGDARMKRIMLTPRADAIVEDLVGNAVRMDEELLAGFSGEERLALAGFMSRLMANIDAAHHHRGQTDVDVTGDAAESGRGVSSGVPVGDGSLVIPARGSLTADGHGSGTTTAGRRP